MYRFELDVVVQTSSEDRRTNLAREGFHDALIDDGELVIASQIFFLHISSNFRYNKAARPNRPAPITPGTAVATAAPPPAVALEAAELILLDAEAALLDALASADDSDSDGTADEMEEATDDKLELTLDRAESTLEEAEEAAEEADSAEEEEAMDSVAELADPVTLPRAELAPPVILPRTELAPPVTLPTTSETCAQARPASARRGSVTFIVAEVMNLVVKYVGI